MKFQLQQGLISSLSVNTAECHDALTRVMTCAWGMLILGHVFNKRLLISCHAEPSYGYYWLLQNSELLTNNIQF